MKILAILLSLLAAFCDLFPVKKRIVYLSRQSALPSLDFTLLSTALRKQHPNLQQTFVLTNPETANPISFVFSTCKQMWFARTSSLCLLDGYIPAISIPNKRSGITVIQLWHALGAIKCFGYQSLETPAGRSITAARIGKMHKNYDFIVAGGPGAIPAYTEAFDCHPSIIAPIGLPRIDYLLDPETKKLRLLQANNLAKENRFLRAETYLILYAPTLRKGDGYHAVLQKQLQNLAKQCPDDTVIVVAKHPLDRSSYEELCTNYPCLKFVSANTIDLLSFADCVITDYSAIAFEAALLEKQVFFYVPDIEEYRRTPGLSIDPTVVFSDISSTSATVIMHMCSAYLSNRKLNEQYQAFMRTYFKNCYSDSTERILRLIEDAL